MQFSHRETVTGGRLEKIRTPIKPIDEDHQIDPSKYDYFIHYPNTPAEVYPYTIVTKLSDEDFDRINENIAKVFGPVALMRTNKSTLIEKASYKAPFDVTFEIIFKKFKNFTRASIVPHMVNGNYATRIHPFFATK